MANGIIAKMGLGLFLVVAPLAASAPAALAGEMCGLKTFLDELKAGVKHEGFSSMCMAGQGCTIVSQHVVGHRLQLTLGRDEKAWRIMLTVPRAADLSEGVELVVDSGEPMRVPPEFLDDYAAGRAIAISPKLADVVLKALKPGKMLHWRYVLKGGEGAEAAIPLKGFGRVFDWAGCALKKLDETAGRMHGSPAGQPQ